MAISSIGARDSQIMSPSFSASSGGKTAGASASGSKGLNAELDDYLKMSPAQRFREALLKKLGLSEDDLAKMSPEERKKVDQQMSDLAKQEMQKTSGKAKGNMVDVSA
ncbi:hypothetical protein [Pseudoduganella violacea]|uniref:Uncharacterized protein n=1 Tax=Pseudoduganella violacea TaxID=1715466 RepID=A0A7W5B6S5_9BURK|nr:hypothetical protein [Pseudoduganella violacea]MBB3117461.1 hypothetical protein [Pseudoduganella violacea]